MDLRFGMLMATMEHLILNAIRAPHSPPIPARPPRDFMPDFLTTPDERQATKLRPIDPTLQSALLDAYASAIGAEDLDPNLTDDEIAAMFGGAPVDDLQLSDDDEED